MKIANKLAALTLAASMVISSTVTAIAQEPSAPMFNSFTGQAIEIYPMFNDSGEPLYGRSRIRVVGDEGTAVFDTDYNTFLLGDEVQLGDTIRGYFLADAPVILIYPPHYTIQLLVNGEFTNVHIDRFYADETRDGELVSSDGTLQLRFNEDTNIILQDGQPFDFELGGLDGRILVVVYGPTTRTIPAITLPAGVEQIVVLFERIATLPQDIDPGMTEQIDEPVVREDSEPAGEPEYIEWVDYGVFVNDSQLHDVTWEQIGQYILLPVRRISEELGATVSWNDDTNEVTVQTSDNVITFIVGSAEYTLNGEVVTFGEPPQASMLIGDRTFVPIRFFGQEVFGMNNAYLHAGEVHINDKEPMQ